MKKEIGKYEHNEIREENNIKRYIEIKSQDINKDNLTRNNSIWISNKEDY